MVSSYRNRHLPTLLHVLNKGKETRDEPLMNRKTRKLNFKNEPLSNRKTRKNTLATRNTSEKYVGVTVIRAVGRGSVMSSSDRE